MDAIANQSALARPKSTARHLHLDKGVLEGMSLGAKIYDDEVPGLYVVRGANGWSFRAHADLPTHVMKTRLSGSPTVVVTLGRYPALSIKAARRDAKLVVANIKSGNDPRRPTSASDDFTLTQAYDWYCAEWGAKQNWSPWTKKFYRQAYNALADWHDKPLKLILMNRMALVEQHKKLTKRGESVANSAIQLLGYVARFAQKTRPDLPDWPEGAVTFHKRKSRRADGMGVADFAAWWKQAQTSVRSEVRRQMMLFELLTGLRGNDVRTAKHEHIKDGFLYVPAPKGGTKRAFHLPLTQAMLDCVAIAKSSSDARFEPSAYLFPSWRAKGAPFAETRVTRSVALKSGHLLRHSFSNAALAAGLKMETIAMLMNHHVPGMTADYTFAPANRMFFAEEMAKVSAKIMGAINQ